jgi:hypothetical protein
MCDFQKPHKRLRSKNRSTSWLVHPRTIKMAFTAVRIVFWVAKALDMF